MHHVKHQLSKTRVARWPFSVKLVRTHMSNEKSVDVSFVDSRILSAIKEAKYTVRATRTIEGAYEIDFGDGMFYVTLAVEEGEETAQTLGVLTERIDLLRKVITNYTAPMRYGPVSAFGSGTAPKPKPKARETKI
jgi:hypothetical protein